MDVNNYVDKIEKDMYSGSKGNSKLKPHIYSVYGFASSSVRHFLNNLCAPDLNYLEIGTFRGASLLAAAYENNGRFYGIDNFCDDPFGAERWNESGWPNIRSACLQNIAHSGLKDKITFFNSNAFDVDEKEIKDIDVLHIDLILPRKDILSILEKFKTCTKDVFVFIMSNFQDSFTSQWVVTQWLDLNKFTVHYHHYWVNYGSTGQNVSGIYLLERKKNA